MKFYNLLIQYRFWLGLLSIAIGIIIQVTNIGDFWGAFTFYLLAFIAIFTHFFIGPLRLVQEPMENGEFEKVNKILDSIWFPALLFKPVRSNYYALKGNLAMMNKDFATAEENLKKSAKASGSMVDNESASKLQLGMLALQKSNYKEAAKYLREAIQKGFNDKDSEAMANLGMVQVYMNRMDFKTAKMYFRRAKSCGSKNEQVVSQIKDLDKYLSRVPG
ncbi:MAG: tetratricopeptide repeat protein [Bacteroidia bacterium]